MPMPYDLYGNPVGQQNPNSIYTPGFMSPNKPGMSGYTGVTQYGNANIYTPSFQGQGGGQSGFQPQFTPGGQTINDYPLPGSLNSPGMPGWVNPDQQLNPYIGGTFNLAEMLRPDGVNGFEVGSSIPISNPYINDRNTPNNVRPQGMMPQGQPMPTPIKDPRIMANPTQTAITQQLMANTIRDQILMSLMQNPGQFNFNPTRMF